MNYGNHATLSENAHKIQFNFDFKQNIKNCQLF